MKIYTRQGDTGQTGLFDGTKVRKDDLRLETYGTVDELNSALGVALASCGHAALQELLQGVQEQLLILGSDLATPLSSKQGAKITRITEAQATELEGHIDAATAQLPVLKRFILPGGSVTAAHLHLARTICRRAERLAVRLAAQEDLGPHVVVYLNRLSDLLFTWARWANQLDGRGDVEWRAEKPESGTSRE